MALEILKLNSAYLEGTLNLHELKPTLGWWFKGQQLLDLFQDLQTHILELLVLVCVSEIDIFLFECYLNI